MNKNTHKKIEAAMRSIDNLPTASPDSFFFTRLEARMQYAKKEGGVLANFIMRPAVAFGCLGLVLLINAFIIFKDVNTEDFTMKPATNIESGTLDEYNQLSSNLYEIENTNP